MGCKDFNFNHGSNYWFRTSAKDGNLGKRDALCIENFFPCGAFKDLPACIDIDAWFS